MEYDQDEIADQLLDELLLALDITTLNEEDEQRLKAPLIGFELKRTALLAQFDDVDPQALQPLFAQLLRNARSVRDHLGDDSWRVVHQLRQRMATFNPSLGASAARRACEGLSSQLAAFFGLCNETMPHHYGWRFMDIGRFLDRVLGLLSLLKLTLNAPHSPGLALWRWCSPPPITSLPIAAATAASFILQRFWIYCCSMRPIPARWAICSNVLSDRWIACPAAHPPTGTLNGDC